MLRRLSLVLGLSLLHWWWLEIGLPPRPRTRPGLRRLVIGPGSRARWRTRGMLEMMYPMKMRYLQQMRSPRHPPSRRWYCL